MALRLIDNLERSPKWAVAALTVALLSLIGWLDQMTGKEISLSVFYLVPISIGTWILGQSAGAGLAFASGVVFWWLEVRFGGRIDRVVAVYNALIHLLFFLVVTYVLVKLKASRDRAEELARLDPLTHLFNRRGFYELAEREILRARRTGTMLTVVLMDLDNFKEINDSLGHLAGDEALRLVADRMKMLRRTDVPARLGGDEFAILMSDTSCEGALVAVERLREDLGRAMKERAWPVTLSVGVVSFATPPEAVVQMIEDADRLMYEVKSGAKDGVRHRVVGATAAASPEAATAPSAFEPSSEGTNAGDDRRLSATSEPAPSG